MTINNSLKAQAEQRESQLTELISFIDQELEGIRAGSLRVSEKSGRTEYYWYNSGKKSAKQGIYISKNNMQLVSELAKKDYLIKTRKSAVQLLNAVHTFNANYDENSLFENYQLLIPARKKLVTPLFLSDDEYAEDWLNKPYTTKGGFDSDWDIKSSKGECMRSKSEVLIASLLSEYGIPYKYEYPIILDDGRTYHPDFLILNKRTRKEFFWEHLGKLGDIEYANQNIKRVDLFARNGILQGVNIIYTFETNDKRTSIDTYKKYIETYLL